MLSEKQKDLLFYTLESLSKTLRESKDGDFYFNLHDYNPYYELRKLGNFKTLTNLIDRTMSELCK